MKSLRKKRLVKKHFAIISISIFIIGLVSISLYKNKQNLGMLDGNIHENFSAVQPLLPFSPDFMINSNITTHGSRTKKQVAITFDADMTEQMRLRYLSGRVKSWYDPRIVSTLTQMKIKATFFLTGMWIEMYPKATQAFAANSLFELSNHTYDHPSFAGKCYALAPISNAQSKKDEIQKTQKLLKYIAGVDNHYFRFPGGCYAEQDLKLVQELGLQAVQWDVISGDAFNKNMIAIEQNVINQVQNGSIIVFHLNGAPNAPATADALPVIIENLKKRGFSFVKVSDMLE